MLFLVDLTTLTKKFLIENFKLCVALAQMDKIQEYADQIWNRLQIWLLILSKSMRM